ncbi:MAG: tyrosine-type recombinase/integrase [bacterium]|nr:tyrosine-type recombinase/integrase [bacterium]
MLLSLDDFLLNLQTNNYSPETVYNYERDLATFDQFLTESGTKFEAVDKQFINRYKAYLTSRDRKTAKSTIEQDKMLVSRSINRMLSSLRSYLRYLIDMDKQVPVPPEAVKLIKTERKHPQVAELNDLIRLIECPSTLETNKLVGLRNRAILEVLFSTGMRISELCGLNRNQIDDSGKIFVMGKGKKQRFVYMTDRAMTHLNRYLATRNDNYSAVFIPYSGRNVTSMKKRISTNYLQEKIKNYREKLKINVPTSAHSLRHGFATYLAEEGASPVAIQILLGHESLDTTTRYVHASDRFAQETHRKFHPLAENDD